MTHHNNRTILVKAEVTVGTDAYDATLMLTRPAEPVLERDMEVIKAQIEAELSTWLVPKIESGETP